MQTSWRRWFFVTIGLLILIGLATVAAFVMAWLAQPPFKSIDEVDVAQIERLAVLTINRPDSGPDISAGGKELLVIPSEFYETLLAPLRNAPAIAAPRGIYLGQINLVFKDGRKLIVMLHRAGDATLQFTIGSQQYEVAPLGKFLKPLIETEAKVKSR